MEKIKKYDEEKIKKISELLLSKKNYKHSEEVRDICEKVAKKIFKKTGYKVDTELLYKSAWLHDIGKIVSKKEHSKYSVDILRNKFKNDKDLKKISCVILAHNKEFNPNKDVMIEASILRIADKLDKYRKLEKKLVKIGRESIEEELDKIDKKYEENIKKIKEYLKNNCGENLEQVFSVIKEKAEALRRRQKDKICKSL